MMRVPTNLLGFVFTRQDQSRFAHSPFVLGTGASKTTIGDYSLGNLL